MNKFAIPAILLSTVMIAGIFAFMPVEQASTVHAGVLESTLTPFKIACAEISLTGASDDGEITLDVNGNNPIVVRAIYLESGTGTGVVTDVDDIITITGVRVDTVSISRAGAVFSNISFDAAPTEGELFAMIDVDVSNQVIGELIADTDIGVTIDGTVNTDTTKYIVTFAGLQITNDAAPTCDVSGVQ